jgi:GntR family transcriptional regulator
MPTDGRFRFHVAPSSGVPIYRQIFDQVRAQIATGRLTDGDFLPSVRQVAGELAVNPMTVSKAYSLLERDGVVELVRGHGMRVVGRTLRQRQSADRDEVVRLVRRLVKRGRAAGLSPEDICALVNAAFEERHHERVRPHTQ